MSDSLWPHGLQQASLSITNFWSLLKIMFSESVMPSYCLILCRTLLLLPSVFPIIRVFSNESVLHSSGQSIGVSASVFPIAMYGCESCTIKKAECRRIDAFELWCWRRLLRVPWTARRSNQSILKEINPEYLLEGLMLKASNTLATWCEEMTHWNRPWCWERLKIEGEEDDRGWDGWMASLAQWTRVWVNSRSWWWTGKPGMLQSMGSQRVGHNWGTELNWLRCFLWY